MIRFIFLAAVVLLVVWAVRSLRRGSGGDAAVPPPEAPPKAVSNEEMVACTRCGVHLPRGEAESGRDGFFCGEAHRLEHEKSNPGP